MSKPKEMKLVKENIEYKCKIFVDEHASIKLYIFKTGKNFFNDNGYKKTDIIDIDKDLYNIL